MQGAFYHGATQWCTKRRARVTCVGLHHLLVLTFCARSFPGQYSIFPGLMPGLPNGDGPYASSLNIYARDRSRYDSGTWWPLEVDGGEFIYVLIWRICRSTATDAHGRMLP